MPGYVQLINNYHGRVGTTDSGSHNPNYRGNFAASYVTGTHAFKAGMDLNGATRWADNNSVVPYSYVVSTLANNGAGLGIPVPQSLTPALGRMHGSARRARSTVALSAGTHRSRVCARLPAAGSPNKVSSEGGLFVQDKWTMNRLTLSTGVRFDWFNSENPAFHLGPSITTPNRNYDVPAFKTTRYKDITPKVAAAYDLFGDGKTAIKVNVGRYVLGQALVVGGLASQPGYNVQLTSSRTWTDNNKNFIPDCDLTNPNEPGPDADWRQQANRYLPGSGGRQRPLLQQLAQPEPGRAGRREVRLGEASLQLGILRQRAA